MERKQQKINDYFDIEGLIDEQVKMLDSIGPSLYKEAVINGQNETETFAPSDSAWVKELLIFKTADINRPMLTDSYDVREHTKDNRKSLRYISKTPGSTEVDSIAIRMNEEEKPHIFQAYLSRKNTLFRSVKSLEVTFADHQGKQLISSYKIQGWQKMASKDSTVFDISAKILYP
jgi:hypothetical protein